MFTRVSRVAGRTSHLKKMVLNVDLNVPAIEEGTSLCPSWPAAVPVTTSVAPQLLPIDVDLIDEDDDVLISSPRAFAEAKDKSRNNRRRRVVDVDAEDSSSNFNNRNKRRRVPGNQQVINCESYKGDAGRPREPIYLPPPPPPPPKELTFSCPVCMGPLVEEMSTKCGHIFCKECIKTAITVQKKCPTCRRKTTAKDIMRVYLPSAIKFRPQQHLTVLFLCFPCLFSDVWLIVEAD
ncbi:hypothetical protein V2J09_003239 [Rumex salicifolius]